MVNTSMDIVDSFEYALQAGYCKLQEIFWAREPEYNNYGVYGWNCDLYVDQLNCAIISTGYRNLKGDEIPDAIINEYKDRAIEIRKKYQKGLYTYDEARAKIVKNSSAFTAAAIEAIRY